MKAEVIPLSDPQAEVKRQYNGGLPDSLITDSQLRDLAYKAFLLDKLHQKAGGPVSFVPELTSPQH